MTLALKSWFEVRRRMWFVLLAWAMLGLMFFPGQRSGSHHETPAQDLRDACTLEILMLMLAGSVLAGSGVTTQNCSALTARMPDSVLYTLSLPVTRRGALLTRAVEGIAGLVPTVLLFWTVLALGLRLIPAAPPFHVMEAALLFQLAAAVLAYSLKLLFAALMGEMEQSFAVIVLFVAGGMATSLGWRPVLAFLNFASGATYMISGHIAWWGLAVCAALSCAFCFPPFR